MNYADLFRVTLPETALEVAALLVLIVDLGFLRKAALKTRVAVAALLGVAGCGAALWAMRFQYGAWLTSDGEGFGPALLGTGGYVGVAQTGILILTALTLLLLIDSVFTRHVGEFVAGSDGGSGRLAGCRRARPASHFRWARTAESELVHHDRVCQEFRQERRSSTEVLPFRRNVSSVSFVWLQLFLWLERHHKSDRNSGSYFKLRIEPAVLRCVDSGCGWTRIQSSRGAVPPLGARHL